MRNLFIAIMALALCAFSCAVSAEDDNTPHNIRIDVEYKQFGGTSSPDQWDFEENTSYAKQFIVVLDGYPASIFVGKQVPFVSFYRRFLFDRGYINEDEEMVIKDIGTKLKVEPHITGENSLQITLTPEISFTEGGNPRTINIGSLSTTVVAQDGQSISIGGLHQDAEFDTHFFRSSSQSNLEIILTPHIQ